MAVVSLGSAKNLILQGGPQPWVHDRSTHYEEGITFVLLVLSYLAISVDGKYNKKRPFNVLVVFSESLTPVF